MSGTGPGGMDAGGAGLWRPGGMAEALDILGGGGCTILAGGTDLYAATERAFLPGRVLDLSGIAGLSGIAPEAGGLRIGAMTTWSAIARADLPPACDALRAAAREVGGVQVQNAGTIGGNLCNGSPAADGVPPLLVLGASVELVSREGMRRLPLGAFLLGPRRTARAPGEILTAVLLPAEGLAGRSAFLKLGARRHLVISIAMVAARVAVAGGRVAAAALSVGAASPVAVRMAAAEAALVGAPVEGAAARVTEALVGPALSPLDDVRADAGYRRRAAAELLRRAVAAALGDPAEGAA